MVIRLALMLLLFTGAARADRLRIVVGNEQPVAGEMILVTLRGEYTHMITLEELILPKSADFDWVQLSRDRWQDEQVEGRSVRVFERRLAIFPRHGGDLRLGPLTHRLTIMDGAGRTEMPVEAKAVTISVAPYPGEAGLLSASNLTVEDALSTEPGALRDGETLVRKVTLRAEGTLPQMLPPRPVIREPWLISFTAPEERTMKPTPGGPVTTVTWEWHLRPKTGEPGVIPPIEIPWFDTSQRRMRMAEIPAIPLGYQSFHANQTGTDRLPGKEAGLATAAVGLGLAVGIVGALAGLGGQSRSDLNRRLRRLAPFDRSRWQVRRAARSGDLLDLRAAAARYLDRRHGLGLPVSGTETRELDRALYGREPEAAHGEARDFLRMILRHR
ncbi:hypothetical protein HDIA_1828 [Hartmannibacter diazotrophicus]|uniref:Oxygen tolerance n=1 Tax=Hartmannibacter diazotrophicus TaxID=1482074 RepID=A0A2C9D5B7_9HYPH|nr:BatD family protein [Hartmannibacter diazotrophicus]SON55369.1 hypothetical protein HDIA_1828 [Hartmannibacter diazotrophicus]